MVASNYVRTLTSTLRTAPTRIASATARSIARPPDQPTAPVLPPARWGSPSTRPVARPSPPSPYGHPFGHVYSVVARSDDVAVIIPPSTFGHVGKRIYERQMGKVRSSLPPPPSSSIRRGGGGGGDDGDRRAVSPSARFAARSAAAAAKWQTSGRRVDER